MLPRRILFFTGGSYVSGMEIVNLGLMSFLAKEGIAIHAIVSGWNDGDFPNRLKQANIPFSELKLGTILSKSSIRSNLDGLVAAPRSIIALGKILREFRPDLVVHTAYRYAFVAMPITRLYCNYNILHLHEVPGVGIGGIRGRAVTKMCDRVICVSSYVASEVCKYADIQNKVIVVNNGVKINESEVGGVCEHQGRCLKISAVGQIIPTKKIPVILDALELLLNAGRDVSLDIFGAPVGACFASLHARVENSKTLNDKVRWRGFEPCRSKLYSQTDILVSACSNEPFGTTALEAGIWEKAVVAPASGGFPEIIDDEVNGLLFEPDCPASLAAKIERLVAPEIRKALGVAHKKRVEELFSLDAMGSRFLKAIQT